MIGQETRNKLTYYWSKHDIKKGGEFAILTNIIHQEWAGVSVAEHKDMKGLSSHNPHDHMSEAELIFTALCGKHATNLKVRRANPWRRARASCQRVQKDS